MNAAMEALRPEGLEPNEAATYVEQLAWTRLAEGQVPDLDAGITVLMALDDGECWQGYWDDEAECWCGVDGSEIAARVVAYSDPKGPLA